MKKALKSHFVYAIISLGLLGVSSLAVATVPTLGQAALALTEPVGMFRSLVDKICYILGIVLVVGSGVKYKQFRLNPNETPISKAIIFLLLGIGIGLLPFVPTWLAKLGGVTY